MPKGKKRYQGKPENGQRHYSRSKNTGGLDTTRGGKTVCNSPPEHKSYCVTINFLMGDASQLGCKFTGPHSENGHRLITTPQSCTQEIWFLHSCVHSINQLLSDKSLSESMVLINNVDLEYNIR